MGLTRLVPPRPRTSRALLAATVAAQLHYPRLAPTARRRATGGIVALLTGTAVASLAERRGPRRAAAMVTAAAGLGTASEVVGVATGRPFGRYAYGSGLGPHVAGVAAAVPAAWTMMAPAAWSAAGWVAGASPARRAAVAAAALTAWDVALDPRMVREGYWTWEAGGAYEDVPASNFAGWLLVSLAIFGAWAVLDDEPPDDADLALYAWTWVGEVVANLAFWRRPRVAAAGGVAMGLVAVPALRARLRA